MYRKNRGGIPRLEGTILREGIAGQPGALGRLCDFDANRRRIRSCYARRTQHRELAEYFAVYLGDQVILAIGVAAPDLPELNRTYGHKFFLMEVDSRLPGVLAGVNRARGYRGLC